MKNILLLLLSCTLAFGANIQVRDIPNTTVLPATNDYLMVDGSTHGTAKSPYINLPQVVLTRAALVALSVTGVGDNATVMTLGGTTAGDGGATTYYYNSSSTATPNGTTILQPTVGAGRWLASSSSNLPTPTVSTLGGVYSKAPVANQYLTSLGTDGTFTLGTVTTANITGLGTMSAQNANGVAITGGTINGATVGATTPATGAFTTLTNTGTQYSGVSTVGASAGFNHTLYGYDNTTQRPWALRDDISVNRLRFSRGGSDYWFWDVLKVPSSDNVDKQSWRAVSQLDFTAGSTQTFSITPTGVTTIGTSNTTGNGNFASITTDGNATIGNGSAASTRVVAINGGTNTNAGSYVDFQRGGSSGSKVGVDGPITGSGTGSLALWAPSTQGINLYTNGSFSPAVAVSTAGNVSIAGTVAASNLSGTNTGDQTNVSGNAGTATALQTARTIGGSSFNGTANVTSFPSPGAIGSTTPSTGAFTALNASGIIGTTYPTGDIRQTLNDTSSLTLVGGTGLASTIQIFGGTHGSFPKQIYYKANNHYFATQAGSIVGEFNSSGLNVAGTLAATNFSGSSSGVNTGDQTLTSLLPSQAGNAGKYLTTNGTTASWGTVSGGSTTVINVRDYGATGNGTTDDRTAINAAIAALSNYSTLYFPAGRYRITNGLNTFNSLSGVTICGDGWSSQIYNDSGAQGGNTFVVPYTNDHVTIRDLAFLGTSTVRGNGIHVRFNSSYSSITNCFFQGCSDFAVHVSNDNGTTHYSQGFNIENNMFYAPLGDGVHVGNARDVLISGNMFINTGDDSIGVIADAVGYPPERVTIVGNHIMNSGSRGIAIEEANDITVVGNSIRTTQLAGIHVGRYQSTTAYSSRIHIKGNKVYNAVNTPGPRASIWCSFMNECSITENDVYGPANGAGVCVLDFNDVVIRGNTMRAIPFRGIITDDSTTTNVANTWYNLVVDANVIQYVMGGEAIYIVPASGKTLNGLMISSNVCMQVPGGNWIYYDRITTGKVGNNTARDSQTVSGGGSVSGVTAFNNN